MKKRRVRFTATAKQHVKRERLWWFRNRDHQELFAIVFQQAVDTIAVLPGSGNLYKQPGYGFRRLYLRKIACHVYYSFDGEEVTVHAFWGARREHGPLIPEE